MKLQISQFSRIRLVYQRSSTRTKVLVLVAVVLSTVTLLGLRSMLLKTKAQNAAVLDQAAQQEQENEKLEQKIDSLGSLDSVIEIAQNELGLENPDTVVLVP